MVFNILRWLTSKAIPFNIQAPVQPNKKDPKPEPFSEADLVTLARAADDEAQYRYPSPKIEIRIRSERVGTRGFWETIEVERAQFRRDENANAVFESTVIHELYESIDSSMPRQYRSRVRFDVYSTILSDGSILSAHCGERKDVDSQPYRAGAIPWDRASDSINWAVVAVATAKRVRV